MPGPTEPPHIVHVTVQKKGCGSGCFTFLVLLLVIAGIMAAFGHH